MTNEQLRALIGTYISEEIDTISDDENLIYAGIDSMLMMAIVEDLRTRGILVNFLEFSEQPTIEAWLQKIDEHMTV